MLCERGNKHNFFFIIILPKLIPKNMLEKNGRCPIESLWFFFHSVNYISDEEDFFFFFNAVGEWHVLLQF